MRSIDMNIDVTEITGIAGPVHVAMTIHLPDELPSSSVELVFCLSGGGYRRSYWHPTFPGSEGYSFAEFMTGQGRIVLATDHLGMGESSKPEPEGQLSMAKITAANNHALAEVIKRLQQGDWGLPKALPLTVTGVGHSLGGMMLIDLAAAHGGIDRIAVLGWANQPMVLGDTDVSTLAKITLAEGYHVAPHDKMRALFYMPDVPLSFIEADEATGTPMPSCLGRDALQPGIMHEASARIRTPVLLGYGDVDTTPNAWGEAAYFKSSRDITLFVVKGSAHCHNFSSTRRQLWARIDRWIDSTTDN